MINTFGIDSMTQNVNGDIYVSLTEKNTNVNYVMKWDGTSWTEIGGPTSDNRLSGSYISKIRFFNGVLYAGVIRNVPTTEDCFFRYISNTWTPKGILNKPVYDFDIDSTGIVYIAANDVIYKSNGDLWTDITPETGYFTKIAIDSSDRVYTAKLYGGADGFRVYDNNLWSTLPAAPIESDDVVRMCTYGNKFYIAGWSIATDEMIVAVYDGTAWSQLAEITEAFPNVVSKEISSLYADDKGVYITYKDHQNGSVLKWNGLQWISIGDNLQSPNGYQNSGHFNEFLRNPQGYLMAAGSMHNIDGVAAGNIARYNFLEDNMLLPPTIWNGLAFPGGLTFPIKASTTDGTNLYIAVENWNSGLPPYQSSTNTGIFVYKWDGTSWTEVGGAGNRIVSANANLSFVMTMYWNNGKLYVGTYDDNVFVYDNSIWSNLSAVVDFAPSTIVSMAFDKTDPNVFYVGMDSFFRWNGSAWDDLTDDPTFFTDVGGSGMYLTATTDDGKLYVTGYLNDINLNEIGPDGFNVFYNGVWSGLANTNAPLPEYRKLKNMVAYINDIYVLGVDINNHVSVARYNGIDWQVLGDLNIQFPDIANGLYYNRQANDLHCFADALYVDDTGVYISAFGASSGRVLRWNGFIWSDLGTPMINNTGYTFRGINVANTVGIFSNLLRIGTKLYGVGTLTNIDNVDAGNVAWRNINDTSVYLNNWVGILTAPPLFNLDGYQTSVFYNNELYVPIPQNVFTAPYSDFVYKQNVDGTWTELGGPGNRPPFGNIERMVFHNDILYVLGTYHTPAKYENGIWSLLPPFPGGSVYGEGIFNVDSLGRLWVSEFENLWMFDGVSWSNELIVPDHLITGTMDSNDLLYLHFRHNFSLLEPSISTFDGVNPVTALPAIANTNISDTYQFITYNGDFYINATDPSNVHPKVMKWDGAIWTQIGDMAADLPQTLNYEIEHLYVDSRGIYANVRYGWEGSMIIMWNGSNWIAIANEISSTTEPLGSINNMYRSSDGLLHVSGYFNAIDGIYGKANALYAVSEPVPSEPRLLIDGGAGNDGVGFIDGNAWSGLQSPTEMKAIKSFGGYGTPGEDIFFATAVGGYSNLWYVAKYENGVWSNIADDNFAKMSDGNLTGGVFCQAMYNGSLHVGGTFDYVEPKKIAKYNGSSWEAIVFKMGGFVYSPPINILTMASDEARNRLYLGGAFAYSVPGYGYFSNIVFYDDSDPDNNLRPLEYGLNGNVNTITLDSLGNVYCGGTFNSSVGTNIDLIKVAKWNINLGVWQPLGTGVNGTVMCSVKGSGNDIYFGGYFTSAGATPVSRIAKWNGSYWEPLAGGLDGSPRAIVWNDAEQCLYAVGDFYMADGLIVEGLAKWNGLVWSKVLPDQINFTGSEALYLCK